MTNWLDLAACRDVDPEIFFPTGAGVVDFFPDDTGRTAHLKARSDRRSARADEFFAKAPDIAQLDVVASKLP